MPKEKIRHRVTFVHWLSALPDEQGTQSKILQQHKHLWTHVVSNSLGQLSPF